MTDMNGVNFPSVNPQIVKEDEEDGPYKDKSLIGKTKKAKVIFIVTTIGYVMLFLIIVLMLRAVDLGNSTYAIGKEVRDKSDSMKSYINGASTGGDDEGESVTEKVAEKVTEGFKAVIRRFL